MTATLLPGLTDLDPISLTDLDATAARQVRVDRKYVLRHAEAAALLEDLPAGARVLEIDGRRSSRYVSVYLDTPDLTAYHRAGRRRRRRFKVRTRSYVETGAHYLEVKTRDGRGVTHKVRTPYEAQGRPRADVLAAREAAFVGAALASRSITNIDPRELRPVLATAYRRITVHLPGDRARATLDLDLTCTALGGARDGQRLDLGHLVVVETKGGTAPTKLDRVLWRAGHRPEGFSKYGIGMAALHPGLPPAKWRRPLRLHLAP